MSKKNKTQEKKYSYITFSVNKEEQFDSIIETLADFQDPPKFYAFIFHDKDKDENGELKKRHLHVFVKSAPLRLSAYSDKFGIPENMLEIPRSVYKCARYLIHADQPEKYQYSIDDVVSSNIDYYKQRWFTDKKFTTTEKFNDFMALRSGRISPLEFIEKYDYELSTMRMPDLIKLFDYSVKNYNAGVRNGKY